ncbi:MAG: ABC transporter permease [Verrucomicrobiota bacterium]|jgi:ABC-type multidrug transport system permease subunit
MLRVLLAKDLRRARRNPLPWLINLIVPLAMTALIGLVFGGQSDSGALGRIRFAVVDEDKTLLSDLLRGGANQGEGGKYLEPVFMEREDALREINANKISAVLIIPTNFMRHYLTAREAVSLELIKNPAESIHPAVLEELLGAVVTALNAVSRNFNSEFPEWQAVVEGKEDYHKVSALIEHEGDKLKTVKKYINPPLVSYEKEAPADESTGVEVKNGATNSVASKSGTTKNASAKAGGSKTGATDAVFAYLLIGLSAMFLLFIAGNAMSDLYRELRQRTFERYQTLRDSLVPFLASKAVFAVVMLLLCSGMMLGGGGLIFRIHWEQPWALMTLTAGYTCFTAALFAVLVALMPDERRAAVLNNLAGMGLGLVGGCAFPPQQLPAFLREHITPLMPSYWFVNTARNLQDGGTGVAWGWVAFKLAVLALVLIVLAAILFRRRFKTGLRA